MPRLLNAQQIFRRLTALDVYRETTGTHGDTTTTANAAKGALSLTVASITNFADLDNLLIIGDGGVELNSVNGAPSGTTIVPKYALAFAQASGAEVIEATKTRLGHLSADGVTLTTGLPITAIEAATSQVPIAYEPGSGTFSAGFTLLEHAPENYQLQTGTPESVSGTGTASDPYQAVIDGLTMGTEATQVFRASGVLRNGRIITVDFLDAMASPGGGINLRRAANGIPVTISFTGLVVRVWTA